MINYFSNILKRIQFRDARRMYSISNVLKDPEPNKFIELKGWISNIRKQKHQIFLDLNDGSTPERLQIVIPANLNLDTKKLSVGSSLETSGSLNISPKGNVELLAKELKITQKCDIEQGYPFAPRKQYPSEYIRQYFHLRPKTRKFSSLLRIRNAATFHFHSVFQDEGFLNIHTPILTSNDCEGAGETFKVIPDNEALLKSMSRPDVKLDEIFFNRKSYLTVSGQLHLEAATNGLGSVYTFGPTFRAENSKSRLHLSEFYMIEAEIPFLDKLEPLLNFVERLIKNVTRKLLEKHLVDIQICQDSNLDELSWLDKEFNILEYEEALGIIENNRESFSSPLNVKEGLKKEHEIFIVKHLGNAPTFVINWPKFNKPFYMRESEVDNSKVLAFDLLFPGIGEVVGGSLRENNLEKLEQRLPKSADSLNWYLDIRRYGGVPTGGFGLGFERYLQTILKIDNIKDTIPFPRWPHNCSM